MKKLGKIAPKSKSKAKATNQQFHAEGLQYGANSSDSSRPRKDRNGLVSLVQKYTYEEICQLKEWQAESILLESNVLRDGQLLCFACWQPMEPVTPGDRKVNAPLVCRNRACTNRKNEVKQPRYAYTPMWSDAVWGEGPQCQKFLRVLYLYTIKVPRDSVLHIIADITESQLHRWYGHLDIVFGSCEFWRGNKVTFAPGVLEWDGFRIGADRNASFETGKAVNQKSLDLDRKVGRRILHTATASTRRQVKKAIDKKAAAIKKMTADKKTF